MIELPCIIKLCSLACTLLAAGSKAFDYEFASHLFEAGDKTGEAALAFREGRERNAVQTAVRDLRKRVERDYGEWLATEFRGDLAGLADAQAAILSLDFVLPRCLPRAEAVIEAKYDAAEIAGLVVKTAGQSDDQFRDGRIGARLLHCLVQRAFEALQEDDAFCRATEIPFRREVLRGLEQIKRGQAALPDAVAEATVAKLLAALDARGGTERAEAAGLERRGDHRARAADQAGVAGLRSGPRRAGERGRHRARRDRARRAGQQPRRVRGRRARARRREDEGRRLRRRCPRGGRRAGRAGPAGRGRAGRAGAAEGGAARGRATLAGRAAGTRGGAGHPAPRRGRCCAPDRGDRRRRGGDGSASMGARVSRALGRVLPGRRGEGRQCLAPDRRGASPADDRDGPEPRRTWTCRQSSRHRAPGARGARERDGAAGGGGGGPPGGAGRIPPRAGAARLGDDAEQPRQRAL